MLALSLVMHNTSNQNAALLYRIALSRWGQLLRQNEHAVITAPVIPKKLNNHSYFAFIGDHSVVYVLY